MLDAELSTARFCFNFPSKGNFNFFQLSERTRSEYRLQLYAEHVYARCVDTCQLPSRGSFPYVDSMVNYVIIKFLSGNIGRRNSCTSGMLSVSFLLLHTYLLRTFLIILFKTLIDQLDLCIQLLSLKYRTAMAILR